MAILVAVVVDNFIAAWIKLPKIGGSTYRRIGSPAGFQAFVAGSSLLQFGISWPQTSRFLNQGMENWGVGGSSPEEWEVSQSLATNSNLMIIGVSVFDLNEHHICETRANLVPLMQTVMDLRYNRAGWGFSKRLLSQYPLAYLRKVFPTAGRSDAVLVGSRRKLPEAWRASAAAADRANSMVLPDEAVLDFGGTPDKLSEWSTAKALRRIALMRSENRGLHAFNGPKQAAFQRMLRRAQQHGRVIVVVMPVSNAYVRTFLTPEIDRDFESMLTNTQSSFPEAVFVRLDQLPAINSDEYFADPVHLNGSGREIATEAFLKALNQHFAPQ